MKIVGVIPARFGSTRFPGKPLKLILGKPLLEWVIRGAQSSKNIQEILVATDHEEIAQLAKRVGVEAIMTDSALPSGTDRIEAAMKGREADVVVNIQGDEPLITGDILDTLVAPFFKEPKLEMATLAKSLSREDLVSKNTAKIVVDQWDHALYFSRSAIPFSREINAQQEDPQGNLKGGLKHIGMYAYRRDFLEKFCRQGPVPIELAEGLEQLRALYLGAKIKVMKVDHESWGVDTPEDVAKVESLLKKK
ncbi:MAG: 3-deoxy-manno-octulosonate cytidylyltransferase [Bdellovibrionales bacterium]